MLHADVTPDGNVLNDAIVGTPYVSEININGGAVSSLDYSGKERFVGEITPSDTGLTLGILMILLLTIASGFRDYQ